MFREKANQNQYLHVIKNKWPSMESRPLVKSSLSAVRPVASPSTGASTLLSNHSNGVLPRPSARLTRHNLNYPSTRGKRVPANSGTLLTISESGHYSNDTDTILKVCPEKPPNLVGRLAVSKYPHT